MKFHVVIVTYNVEEWIEENLQVLKQQTYRDFRAVIIDDQSTDRTVDLVRKLIQGDDRFKLVLNQEKKYKTRNVVEAISMADADDDDVFVFVDGDDNLAHKNVLQRLHDVYQEKNCWMTYGSFTTSDSSSIRSPKCYAYNEQIIRNNAFRETRWLASHLKTFKYKLWKQLDMDIFYISNKEIKRTLVRSLMKLNIRRWYHWKNIKSADLHDVSGKYIRRIDDKAFTFPMLEMAGDKAVFIDDVMYVYHPECMPYDSEEQNYGINKSEKWHTRLIREILIHKQKYTRLKDL